MNPITPLWYILSRREKIEGTFLLCGMVLGAFFEAVSIGLVIPFIAVLKDPELLSKSRYLSSIIARLNVHDPRQLFFLLGPVLIVIFIIKTFYLIQLYRWLFSYSMRKEISLARQLLTAYLEAPYTLHLQRNTADMIKVAVRSVEEFWLSIVQLPP